VWIVLLALLGIAHARMAVFAAAGAGARRMIQVLLVLCLAYPLYTGGLANDIAAMIGNFVVLAWAVATLIVVSAHDRMAGVMIAPMILWIGYANAIAGAALG
jgi:benzodiazapine receptor